MTTTNTHAHPWTPFRVLADLFTPRHRATLPGLLTGREAVARALYFEAYQGSKLDMLNYDNTPYLRRVWLVEADRRIAGANVAIPDLLVLRWWGYAVAEWNDLSSLVKKDKREHYYQVKGL